MPMEFILNKNFCVFLTCLRFKKKSVLKRLNRTVYISRTNEYRKYLVSISV